MCFILGDDDLDNEKLEETTTEKIEGDLEKSKNIETAVNPQIDELNADKTASQAGFQVLGDFEKKTVQKVFRKKS